MFLIKFKNMWLKLSIYDVLQNSYNFYLAPLLILQIMPGHKTEYFNCVLCSKRTKPKERRHIDNSIRKYLRKKFLLEGKENSVICSKCRNIYYREKSCHKPTETQQSRSLSSQTSDLGQLYSPPTVSLQLQSTAKTHAYCIVCKKPGPELVVISSECRTAVFVQRIVLIPSGNRCCPAHIGMWKMDF